MSDVQPPSTPPFDLTQDEWRGLRSLCQAFIATDDEPEAYISARLIAWADQ